MMNMSIFQKKTHKETSRKIRANDRSTNQLEQFPSNEISTTKYNLITFLPKNLWEQFQRIANAYFLFLVCLQFIPQISSLTPGTSIAPLTIVLLITAIKDAMDDIRRHRNDQDVNRRETKIFIDHHLVITKWKDIQTGDVVWLENNELVPADIVLMTTSESNGLCFIETAELDGETNLKLRRTPPLTYDIKSDHVEIECEPPNTNLGRFEGNLNWNGEILTLNNENILLRGTKLRNTRWIRGVVCYTGSDTKLMRNSGRPLFKRTKLDHLLNRSILGIFLLLIIMSTIMTISSGFWESHIGYYFQIYRRWPTYVALDQHVGALEISLLTFLSYVIILHTIVPISLYVSLEMIRLIQSKWIDWDNRMYYEPSNVQAQARTTTLNEQLGQIDYIFTDKTGTLTQNIMTFKMCSIRGRLYGNTDEKHSVSMEVSPSNLGLQEYQDYFEWHDDTLLDAIEKNDIHVHRFFTLLSLCHTVMSEEKDNQIIYQAQSPDDHALVSAARVFGFTFVGRTQRTVTVQFGKQEKVFDLLEILDFDNDRKRMSVILKRHGKIVLYCKGADSQIKKRLAPSESEIMAVTDKHLHKLATDGLRLLCLAYRELNENDYDQWAHSLKIANTSMERREEKVKQVYEEIEQNLQLIGVTAIEDKLQDKVPQCLQNLLDAGIKIWVLTGDKLETARNIAVSCRLITHDMKVFVIEEEMENAVDRKLDIIRNELSFDTDGLLITGEALLFALDEKLKMKFLEISIRCRVVICCRVTPLQKARVVDLVMMMDEKKITLAIGDGANDVSMIQKAHIGVGISGREGRQAVLASDYSLGQFHFLERLLLVHGRWSYIRISKFLRYFFYKNIAFTLSHFWLGFFCGFSAQTLYDPILIATYNIFFTSLPVLVMGAFEQDISADHALSRPHLYKSGQRDELFNKKIFLISVLHGILTSCIVFFVTYLSLSNATRSNGMPSADLQSFGFAVATITIIIVNLQNALEMWYWISLYHFFLWGTIIAHFLFHFAWYSTIIDKIFHRSYTYVGVAQVVLSTSTFWLTLSLSSVILLLPIFTYEFFRIRFQPTDIDRARLNQKYRHDEQAILAIEMQYRLRPTTVSPVSGYAFAQESGLGHLIMSGQLETKLHSSNRIE